MHKLKTLTVFGTRPEAIKMAPLVKEIYSRDNIESYVCVTAQHREMLDQVLDIFNIKPEFDLNIMKKNQTIGHITSKILNGLDSIYKELKPDIVLVHGDTTTTFSASLSAFYNQIKVGHVEAGLRTFDKYSPYPEEMNRRLTGALSDLHFAPTIKNKSNLLNEGINEKIIFITGNTAIDALKTTVVENYNFNNNLLNNINFSSKKIILVTSHRRENLGNSLENICFALKKLVDNNQNVEIIWPVHLNPAVRDTVFSILSNNKNIHLIEPLDVQEMHNLMAKSYLVLTDSGGLQEEAPSLAKPVLVMRKETERPEAIKAGTVKLVGLSLENIYNEANILLNDDNEYSKMAKSANPYGDGFASKRITDFLQYNYKLLNIPPKEFNSVE
jgi:UDP-N-acetylglucosamine 2-epimerase (non-hydrolysing)